MYLFINTKCGKLYRAIITCKDNDERHFMATHKSQEWSMWQSSL